jgi:hypothetical protein
MKIAALMSIKSEKGKTEKKLLNTASIWLFEAYRYVLLSHDSPPKKRDNAPY